MALRAPRETAPRLPGRRAMPGLPPTDGGMCARATSPIPHTNAQPLVVPLVFFLFFVFCKDALV